MPTDTAATEPGLARFQYFGQGPRDVGERAGVTCGTQAFGTATLRIEAQQERTASIADPGRAIGRDRDACRVESLLIEFGIARLQRLVQIARTIAA
jgi:hypothetical protein